jgi:hypothetical protein
MLSQGSLHCNISAMGEPPHLGITKAAEEPRMSEPAGETG